MILTLGPQCLKYLLSSHWWKKFVNIYKFVLQDSRLHLAFLWSAGGLASDYVPPLRHFSRTSHPSLRHDLAPAYLWDLVLCPLPVSPTVGLEHRWSFCLVTLSASLSSGVTSWEHHFFAPQTDIYNILLKPSFIAVISF